MEEIIKCDHCSHPMNLVGETGRTVEIIGFNDEGKMERRGMRSQGLYQCPECKTVKLA